MTAMDWTKLGEELRQAADDAHSGSAEGIPPVDQAWWFLLENPECFGFDEWPDGMPEFPPVEAAVAYYRAYAGENAEEENK